MAEFLKRTWAQIDLDALCENYRAIREKTGDRAIMAIVKADAYGHGASYVSRALQAVGADWFGVSNLQEAIQLRSAGITKPILILSYTPPEEAARLSAFRITQTVISREYGERLNACAKQAGVILHVHIKVDTGMSRVGFLCHDDTVIDDIEATCALDHLFAEGIFTHFASADEEDETFTRRQFSLFTQTIDRLRDRGITFALKHCCNSAATMRFEEMYLDMVRPGIILYGLSPAPFLAPLMPLRPAMSLKTVISLVKEVPAGTEVSYGRTYVTNKPTTLATVPIGYADGYPRTLSNRARMLVDGNFAPLVGRVCMDQCLLDVSDIPAAKEGMTVTVFGEEKGACLPIEELAQLSGSLNYESVCLIGKRVPRLFYQNGTMIGKQDYFTPER